MENLLNNRYRVIQTLGSGGFGETFLAEDTQMPSNRRCVIKQLKPIQNNPQIYQLVQERFQREAALLEDLGGATNQIPSLYAYFQSEGQFYVVQEWIEGETLTAKVQQQGLLSESAVREILINLLPVLEYIHSQRIVHRDIKPDNIILRHRDQKPVLIDFGAVRESMGTVINSQGNPTSSIVIGTPGYMASEQAAGRPVYSSDLYSLGLTAIYLLTGRQPQHLDTDPHTAEIMWRHYAGNVNCNMAEVIDRAIAYHPRDRYPTAKAMLDSLKNITNTIPPTQLDFTQPTVVSPLPTPATVAVAPHGSNQTNFKSNPKNSSNSIILGSLIVGGLISASVIISQVLLKPFPSTVEIPPVKETPAVSSSGETPSNITPQINKIPVNSATQIQKTITQAVATPESTPAANNQSLSTSSDYSWLSARPVTDADLDGKDGLQLDIMRNAIFARYGRKFETPGLQDYFNKQSWYRPLYSPKEFSSKLLSKLEQRNVDYITKYQDKYNIRHFKK
ncbi:protein kinase domain-containing protein [Fortiea contorta]|uniref:protein kinase domain-containing protein n=1 Tax=Fortiea contorta TaxID=1892405 RepID=UPI0003489E5E|nr:YARHG domain-containing protein [Fortiea contorta]